MPQIKCACLKFFMFVKILGEGCESNKGANILRALPK